MADASGLPGLYVHVPFCVTRCPYCDFYSSTDLSAVDGFLDALETEAAIYDGRFDPFDSLYVGGGTPSVLGPSGIARLLATLGQRFTFADDTEVTCELNPDDVNSGLLDVLRRAGVNRLSIGVQSFNDRELRFLGRRHDATAARRALLAAAEAGFGNVGIDLMYGLPGQTPKRWKATLSEALAFDLVHLSCYQFTVEDATPFGRMRQEGLLRPTGENRERALFLLTSRKLDEQGFTHYEVSNFARPGDRCSRHNHKYWTHVPYLGLGPAAHSFDGRRRWWNVRSVVDYCGRLKAGAPAVDGAEELTAEQLRLERLYFGFRTTDGVARDDLGDGEEAAEMIARLAGSGVLEIRGDRLVPTREGYLISDRLPLMF